MPSPFYNVPDIYFNKAKATIESAMAKWRELVIIVAAENVALGITQQNKTKLVADAMAPVMLYGQTGSLWQAYQALDDIVITPEMAPYITEARRQWMKNELIKIISSL